MTEDMRERGVQSKWNELFVVETDRGEWIDMAGEGGWYAFSLLSEAQEIADSEDEPCKIVRFVRQAALSSAGTSGTADYWILEWSFKGKNKWQPVDRPPFRSEMEVLSYRQREGFDYRIVALRGDSLSGKGEATKTCPKCGGEIVGTPHGFYCPKPTCKWGWETEIDGSPLQPPSAPDRAEELAREIVQSLPLTRQPMETDVEKVASLLRREMGRWIPVSERLPDTNEAGVSSVFFWVTSEDGWQFGYYRKDAEGECWESERSDAYNEPYTYSTEQVSYWLPESALPAPPREEG